MAIFGCGASLSDISGCPVCRRYEHRTIAQSNDQNDVERPRIGKFDLAQSQDLGPVQNRLGQDSSMWSAGFASAPLTERETATAKGAFICACFPKVAAARAGSLAQNKPPGNFLLRL